VDRRTFITSASVGIVALPFAVEAQPLPKVWRIGLLRVPSTPPTFLLEAFRRGLRELGYIEGQNVFIELRSAGGNPEALPAAASDLVRLNVDVIVASGTQATLAAKTATSTVPIVMSGSGDAVATGLVKSLARPGGNVTGLTLITPEVSGKRLALLKEAVPRRSKVGIVWNPDDPPRVLEYRETESAARTLGLTLQSVPVRRREDLDAAFSSIRRGQVEALVVFLDPITFESRSHIADLAARNRLPVMSGSRQFAEAGCLISYGADLAALYYRAAFYVDKILKGAKPGDLPVEQPTRFELVINLKTAKALGLIIPPTLLLRADEVIQ
jgi:putative ABC transport system substrate-binding protein